MNAASDGNVRRLDWGRVEHDASRGNRPVTLPELEQRRWIDVGSLPTRFAITALDLDSTKNCNLRCQYCFKSDTVQPCAPTMSLQVAMAAVDWLIEASMGAPELNVNLMGGEPLLAWPMISVLTPYAKRRAAQFGKTIQFGTTTNLTLVTKEVVDFSEHFGMGWHASIDGPPDVQNTQRPRADGGGSSTAAERGAAQVLRVRPNAFARATVVAKSADRVFDSLLYFEKLGFRNFAFAYADAKDWRPKHFAAWERNWARIADYVILRYRQGRELTVMAFDYLIEKHLADETIEFSCGAGRGTVLVDHKGDIWPCHRWDGADEDSGGGGQWRFGNIFEPGFDDELHAALLDRDRRASQDKRCTSCVLRRICAGGCPAANLTTTGSIYRQHSADCEALRIVYRHALRFHDTLKAERNPLLMKRFYRDEAADGPAASESDTP